jgi:hypothetical protein
MKSKFESILIPKQGCYVVTSKKGKHVRFIKNSLAGSY